MMPARDLLLTAKNDRRVEFYDGTTHALLAALEMPAPVHELALSPDGRLACGSVFGGGIFGRNVDPDHRIVLIDLASRWIDGFIDVGTWLAPHGLMFGPDGLLWVTAEMNKALIAIDLQAREVVASIDIAGAAHWLVVDPGGRYIYASHKQTSRLGVIDLLQRRVAHEIDVPSRCEGLALSADGRTLLLAAHAAPELHVIDTASGRLASSLRIEGTDGTRNQLRRVRMTPDERYAVVSSQMDGNVAVFDLTDGVDRPRQRSLIEVGKAPMGFGFSGAAGRALVCNHDDAQVFELDLVQGAVADRFSTGRGCEFVQYFDRV